MSIFEILVLVQVILTAIIAITINKIYEKLDEKAEKIEINKKAQYKRVHSNVSKTDFR